MITIKTRHRETDTIIKPASKPYIPHDKLEELQYRIEKIATLKTIEIILKIMN